MPRINEHIHSNCPRDCYDACGILIRKENGKIKQVLGDPDHPVSRGRLCSKCALSYNGVWQDENERLLYPMKRIGPKGAGEFEQISWDKAMDIIATKLKTDISDNGPQSIIHTHYSGTLSLIALEFPMRFFHRLGASEVSPDTICNAAGHAAWELLYGESNIGFDPRTVQNTNCILVWGANPSHSAPHAHKYWLPESPGKVIVIDPVITETARQADIHLQPYPGTDAALAFSLLYVLQNDNRFDQDFIARNTIGYEELLPLIESCDPNWGEQQTGVPAKMIEKAAQWYGVGPSLLWAGQGLQRQSMGGNIMRAIGLLPVVTGNVGKPGAGFYYLNSTPDIAGIDYEKLEGSSLCQNDHLSISHMDFSEQLATGKFKSLLVWNTNPAASAPNQKQLHDALKREDLFTVVIDCFQTDTADYADIVLPAASFLEFDDLTFSYFHMIMGAQVKASEPLGESLPNQEIFRRMAKAMDYEDAELFESDDQLIQEMLSDINIDINFEQLKEKGWFYLGEEAIIFYDDLKFATPSGKIEIASDRAEENGLPRLPSPLADEKPVDGKIRLLTPASIWRMNDSFSNDPEIIKRSSDASITLHPDDADRLNISEGDQVTLSNKAGEIQLTAKIDRLTPSGVALSYKGRWPKLEATARNVNSIHLAKKTDMGESSSVHSTEVTVAIV